MIGIVIPCYNEASRLKVTEFVQFNKEHSKYVLCFVNDGSKDDTLQQLEILKKKCTYPEKIEIVSLTQNSGKAEAVRTGINTLLNMENIQYIGYLDADLSTSLDEYTHVVDYLCNNPEFSIVCGSRIKRMGADISREVYRHYIGRFIATLISIILRLPFYDTQCGAKVFTRNLAENCFSIPFVSKWLFDVEIFLRMKIRYGTGNVQQLIYEYPLQRWIHADGSKIGLKDVFYTPLQLFHISNHYNLFKKYKVESLQTAKHFDKEPI
ncbi:glycosyltransferase [Cytophagaceae bacterium DM2B3-1]|uniref:Glycosyltransferase n=1 Tax=Xanthocytophaga flava TaxID=3048013 RepID=A0ABT7CVB7_9BACT|nr:glycosyltransferase [Xanthocytophaga flavus]MDJ1497466.1 glycosyltransferase [Xanthocytophaga flavus]